MKRLCLSLLSILVAGCGSTSLPISLSINSEYVKTYYEEFIALCNRYSRVDCLTNSTKLHFIKVVGDEEFQRNVPNSQSKVGLCSYMTNMITNTIIESEIYLLDHNGHHESWYPDQVKGLVFHELGHCLLRLPHTNSETEPSIMNSKMYTNDVYSTYWHQMVYALFTSNRLVNVPVESDSH